MRDVAALAGVSLKTVSRVINGESGVSSALVARVRSAADRLDFRPNLAASNLRRADGKTATIGVLLEDVSNPFSGAIHRAIEQVARPRGVAVLAASLDEDPDRERELVRAFVVRRVDGLVIVPASGDHAYLANEQRAGLTLVCVDRPPRFLDADVVVASNARGAMDAVEHLIAHGHRRIGYVGDLRRIYTAAERHRGYVAAMEAAGLEVVPAYQLHDLHSSEAAAAAVTALIGRPDGPTAIFASQNEVTIGAVRAVRAAGRQHDIAVVGFDDIALGDLLTPGLTVVAQDVATIGRLAAEQLFRRLDGDRGPSVETIVPTRLIVRGSGEIRPAG